MTFDINKIIENKTVRGFCNGGSGNCTGIANRALPATGFPSPNANGPQDIGIWVHGSGSEYYDEVDPKAVVKNPQLGDILIYRNPNGGATYSSTSEKGNYKKGDRIGHTVMWLPWPHNTSNITWICDHEQSRKSPTWWTYSGGGDFDCMKAFRVRGTIMYNGQAVTNTPLPPLSDSGPYQGGLKGHKDDLESATTASGVPSADGTYNANSNNGSTYVSGGGSYIRGQNYGGRTTKTGNPNTVYNLASYYERNDVVQLTSARKGEFELLRQKMVDQIPNREREIVQSPELYENSILKSSQSSKQERKQTVSK